jgi:hypothetical protein
MEELKWTVRKAPRWVIPFWQLFAYLIINGGLWKEASELVQIKPDERFNKAVTEHLQSYVEKGVKPPDEIASAILNLADDFLAGNQITIRAGDYISIQNYLRKVK